MFGKKKKFRGRVVQIITQELGIDDDSVRNKFSLARSLSWTKLMLDIKLGTMLKQWL